MSFTALYTKPAPTAASLLFTSKLNSSFLIFIIITMILSLMVHVSAISISSIPNIGDTTLQPLQENENAYNYDFSTTIFHFRSDDINLRFTSLEYINGLSINISKVKYEPSCSEAPLDDDIDYSAELAYRIVMGPLVESSTMWRTSSTGIWSHISFTRCAVTQLVINVYKDRIWEGNTLLEYGSILKSQVFDVSIAKQGWITSTGLGSAFTIYVGSNRSLIGAYAVIEQLYDYQQVDVEIIFSQITECLPLRMKVLAGRFMASRFYIPWEKIAEVCKTPEWLKRGVSGLEYTIQLVLPEGHELSEFNVPSKSALVFDIIPDKLFTRSQIRAKNSVTGHDSNIHGLPMSINQTDRVSFGIVFDRNISYASCLFDVVNMTLQQMPDVDHESYIVPSQTYSSDLNVNDQSFTLMSAGLTHFISDIVPYDLVTVSNEVTYNIQSCFVIVDGMTVLYYPDPPESQSPPLITYTNQNVGLGYNIIRPVAFGHDITITTSHMTTDTTSGISYDNVILSIHGKCITPDKIYTFKDIHVGVESGPTLTPLTIQWDNLLHLIKTHLSLPVNTTIIHIYDFQAITVAQVTVFDPYTSDTTQETAISPKYALCGQGYTGPSCKQPPVFSECSPQFSALKECSGRGFVPYDGECSNVCTCDKGYVGSDCSQSVDCLEQYEAANKCSKHGYIEISDDTNTCLGTCTCDKGWYGDTCSEPGLCEDVFQALHQCSGHGRVQKDPESGECQSTCTCDPGWSSDDCSSANSCEYSKIDIGLACLGPQQQWAFHLDSITGQCTAECQCVSDATINCNGRGTFGLPSPSGECCQCQDGWYGDQCQYDQRCKTQFEMFNNCNGRGTIHFNEVTQQCESQCTCYDPTEWGGELCQQSMSCSKQADLLKCGKYGFIEIANHTKDDQSVCSTKCSCIGLWSGASCGLCPIKCYSRSEYNNASGCRRDHEATPPCICATNTIGQYCQYYSINTSITVRNRVFPSWLISALSSKTPGSKARQFVQDMIEGFARLLGLDIHDLVLTNIHDSLMLDIYLQDHIDRVSIPMNNMHIKEIACMNPDGDIKAIPSQMSFTISVRVGQSFATLTQETRTIQTQWNIIQESQSITKLLNSLFKQYSIGSLTSSCESTVNHDDDGNDLDDDDIDIETDPTILPDEDTDVEDNSAYNIMDSTLVQYLLIMLCSIVAIILL